MATSWTYHSWGTDEGIPNNDIAHVMQGPDQKLWMMTFGGMVRFDGKTFFHEDQYQQVNEAHQAFIARDGCMWFATPHNIQRWKGNKLIAKYPYPQKGVFIKLTHFFEDHAGLIWVSSDYGNLFQLRDQKLIPVPSPSEVTAKFSSMALEDRGGNVWIAGRDGLARWEQGRLALVEKLQLPHTMVRISDAARGGIWIASGHQVYHYHKKLQLEIEIPMLRPGATISALKEDESGRLWIGTYGDGLYLWDQQKLEKIEISNQDVWSICFTHDQQVWIGTGGGGLCRVSPRSLVWLETNGEVLKQTARSMCRDAQGHTWLALQTGVICALLDGKWRYLYPEQDWPGDNAMCLIADPVDGIWLATSSGKVFRYRNSVFQRVETGINQNMLGHVRAMCFDTKGNLWLAGKRLTVHLSSGEWKEYHLPRGMEDIQALCVDHNGVVLAGSKQGRLFSLGKEIIDVTPSELQKSGGIRALHQSGDRLLMGTGGAGLWIRDDDRWASIHVQQGLWDSSINQIATDENQRIWLAGEKGVSIIAEKEIDQHLHNNAKRVFCQPLTQMAKIPNLQANSGYCPASFRDPQGHIWFSMRGGIMIARPETILPNVHPPAVALQSLSINGKPQILKHTSPDYSTIPMKLEKGVKNIHMELSLCDFHYPDIAQIEYHMSGVDTDWVPAGKERIARYSSLPPGLHKFSLRAANAYGVWNEPIEALQVDVEPFLWQRAWFPYLCILSIIAFSALTAHALSARSMRLKTQKIQQESALNQERTRISRDMHDQIGASLTRISLLTELMRNDHNPSLQLERLRLIARDAVTSLDQIVWAVNPRHDHLASLIDYIGQQSVDLLRESNIRCRLDFPGDIPNISLPTKFRHHIFLLSREAIHNAIKHSGASEIRIHLELPSEKQLHMTIEDNGCGFDNAAEHPGNGLRNMRERSAELQGTCSIQSHSHGTHIHFLIPIPTS